MLGWLIISVVTVACTGTLAYFYYKLLNYFIRKNIESDPRPIWAEQVERVTLQVADDDSDEEKDNLLFREINNIVIKIHRA